MYKLISALLLSSCISGNLCAQGKTSKIIPNLKLGYSIFFVSTEKSAHMPEIGYYHMFDNKYFSHGPSFSGGGFIYNGKFNPTFKFAYEFNYYFVDAKMAIFYLDNEWILQPSIGFSVFNQAGILLSTNFPTYDSRSRITSAGIYLNLNTRTRVNKKGFKLAG